MKRESVGIEGVHLVRPTPAADGRGSFAEVFRREWVPGAREMVQANLSRSAAGVLRGLHYHRAQADYWVIIEGRAHVGLYDLRAGSPTWGASALVPLDSEEPAGLYIPPGVAHGFYAETSVVLHYLVDAYYSGEDELGVAWDDPDLGLDWPVGDPTLSERDRANPSLAQALAGAPPDPTEG